MLFAVDHRLGDSRKSARGVGAPRLFCFNAGFSGSPNGILTQAVTYRSIRVHKPADNNLTNRLRVVPSPGRRPFYRFTLDDLDELAGYVAAEANHAKFKKLEKELSSVVRSHSGRPGILYG